MDAGAGEAVAQAGQERGEAGLGRAVDVVRGAPALARHRAHPDEHATAALLEPFGEGPHQQGGADVVGPHDPLGGGAVALGGLLVAGQTDHADRDVGQGVEPVEQRDAAVRVEHVAVVRGHRRGGPRPHVADLPGEVIRVAGCELQGAAVPGEPAGDGAADVRRGAHDQDGLAVHVANLPGDAEAR